MFSANQKVFRIALGLFVILSVPAVRADDASKLQPPHAPSLDSDMFDDDDDFDFPPDFPGMGGPGASPHGLPPGVSHPAQNGANPFNGNGAPPTTDAGGASAWSQSTTTSAKKFRFKLVEGEYWEKGKKRTRGAQTYVSPGGDSAPAPGPGS